MADGIYYTVVDGDCISSIAESHGLFWKTIWGDTENSALRRRRKTPNVLMPGDVVFVPALRLTQQPVSTDRRHVFVRKGTPAKIAMRFQREGQPRANVSYVLVVDGRTLQGQTDAQGIIRAFIPPTAQKATITLREDGEEEVFSIGLGCMDPPDEESGARKRLNNLGYDAGTGDHDQFITALKKFQSHRQLRVTGKLDAETQEKLREVHGI